MQKLLIQAGVDCKETVFAISDANIKKSFILEDINNLLNSGEIPNLFNQEDFIPLIDKLRSNAKKDRLDNLVMNGTNA